MGSPTAIVGPNGAGKSTLLKGVTGSLTPLEGRIGVSFGAMTREDIAYLPQQSDLDRSFPLSVVDLLLLLVSGVKSAHLGGLDGTPARVDAAIAAVGLTGFESRAIATLSGGQLQRALFARLLLQDARLVLLDEPFTAIDAHTMADLITVIQRWVRRRTHGDCGPARRGHGPLVFPDTLSLARKLVDHGPTKRVLTAENQFRARQMCEARLGLPHVCSRIPA